MGCLPIIAAVLAYMIFLFRDPNRLQSEEYQLRQQALRMLYRKGASTEIVNVASEALRIDSSLPVADRGENK
jgi:hypothetical protein